MLLLFTGAATSGRQKVGDDFYRFKSDSLAIRKLLDSSNVTMDADPQKASAYCLKAIGLAVKSNYTKGLIDAKNGYSIVLIAQGKYRQALDISSSTISLSKQINNEKRIAQSYARKGMAAVFIGHFQMAANHLLDAARIIERIGTKAEIQRSLNALSIVFTELKDKQKALDYAIRADSIGKSNHNIATNITTLMQLARARALNNEFRVSNQLFDKLLILVKESKDVATLAYTYIYMAELAVREHQYTKALGLYQQAHEQALKVSIPDCFIYVEGGLARTSYELGNYNEAYKHLVKGIAYAKQTESENMLRELLLLGSEIKEAQNELAAALDYRKDYERLNSRLLNLDLQQNVQRLETEFQTSVKEREIAQQKFLIAQNQLNITQKDSYIVIAVFIIFILIAVTIIIFFNYRNRQKEKEVHILKAVMDGEEKERSRMAKELHDGVGGLLSATKMHLSVLQNDQRFPDVNNHFGHTVSMLDSASQEIRMIAHNLAPDLLVKLGLTKALAAYFTRLQSSDFKVDFIKVGDVPRLKGSFELLVYRIIQELTTNVIKHAYSNYVLVQMSAHDQVLSITVEDNGVGLKDGDSEGIGFSNLKSRIDAFNGYMEIESSANGGTTVFVEFEIQEYLLPQHTLTPQTTN